MRKDNNYNSTQRVPTIEHNEQIQITKTSTEQNGTNLFRSDPKHYTNDSLDNQNDMPKRLSDLSEIVKTAQVLTLEVL